MRIICILNILVTTHTKPVYGVVTTDGRLTLEFTFEEQMRIKHWHFLIRGYGIKKKLLQNRNVFVFVFHAPLVIRFILCILGHMN